MDKATKHAMALEIEIYLKKHPDAKLKDVKKFVLSGVNNLNLLCCFQNCWYLSNRECLVNSKGRSSAACSHQGYRNFKTNWTNFKQKMEAHQQWQKSVQKYDCINPKSHNCNDWKGWCTGPQGWLCQCRGRCLIGTWLTYVIVCI